MGYCVPLLFKGRAQLAGVVFPLICTMFAGVSPDIPALNAMGPVRVAATVLLHSADSSQLMPCQLGRAAYSVSYARWGVELLFLANAEQMHPELFKVDDMLANLQYVLRVAGACVA